MLVSLFFLLAACALAAYLDLRIGRISNSLTYGLGIAALVFHAFGGLTGFAVALVCMCGVLAACLPVFAMGWLKGGDVKLIVACSGLVSFPFVVPFLLYTMVSGAIVSLAVAARFGTMKQSLQAVGTAAHPLLHGVMPAALPFTTRKVPYGVAIFFGALLTSLAMTVVPAMRLL